MSEIRVTTLKDTSGSNSSTTAEIASGRAKAWVNFNGQGTAAIRGSFNVNSITDITEGVFTVNFSTSLTDANYAGMLTTGFSSGVREDVFTFCHSDVPYAPAAGSYSMKFLRSDTRNTVDPTHAMVAIFR